MECNKTFISIKQLEQQDISADKICSILFQLYDELAIDDQAIAVDDLKAFRSHMNTLLDRILKLYKANEDRLSKLALFKRIEDKEKSVEEYLNKINELEEDIKRLDKANLDLKEKTSMYDEILNKNNELEEENRLLKERLTKLETIDLKALEEDNELLLNTVETKEKEYNKIVENKEGLDHKLEDLDKKYVEVNQLVDELTDQYNQGFEQLTLLQEKSSELEELIKENEELLNQKETLEELTKKTNELENVNNTIKDEIKSMNGILGRESIDEDDKQHIRRLESIKIDVSQLLEEFLINNPIEEIEEEVELNNLGLWDYLNLVDNYIYKTRTYMTSYLNTTKNIYKIISIKNSTTRYDEDDE